MSPLLLGIFLVSLGAGITLGAHAIPPRFSKARITLAWFVLPVVAAVSGVLVLVRPNLFSGLIAGFGLYQLFNLSRVIKGRTHGLHLWHVTFRTSMWLIGAQYVLLGLWAAYEVLHVRLIDVLVIAGLLQLLGALIFLETVKGHAARMRAVTRLNPPHDNDLPSVTVAIPARNETDDLHACITSVLTSRYPKLEILVLDDCSQTARTPEIIREFAHQGVRFIRGEKPHEAWLAKNQAYARLAESASGDLVLFAGVDIRFEPDSIRRIVAYALEKNKEMVCVMPLNAPRKDSTEPRLAIPLLQPMRYVWELWLPRRLFKRPPVLSSCWMISRKALADAGGFAAAKRMVVPEAYLAKRLLDSDSYGFLSGGTELGIVSNKNTAAQRDTAVRVSYPQVHRRPEVVAAAALGFLWWVGMPAALIAVSFLPDGTALPLMVALATTAVTAGAYAIVLRLGYGQVRMLHVLGFPIAVSVYVGLLHYSMYKYEFSEVLWKGRDVCVPVMHVVPSLPKI